MTTTEQQEVTDEALRRFVKADAALKGRVKKSNDTTRCCWLVSDRAFTIGRRGEPRYCSRYAGGMYLGYSLCVWHMKTAKKLASEASDGNEDS